MLIYIAINYEEEEKICFSTEKALFDFLNLQGSQHYRGEKIDPFKKSFFNPRKEGTNPVDYLDKYQ